MNLRRVFATLAVLITAALATAGTAQAAFHLMQIREVFPGTAANPNSEYVELQMWSSGQNFVSGHTFHIFNSAGLEVGGGSFGGNVPNGADQSTILLATPGFGVAADAELPPGGTLDPVGGKFCFDNIDCVSWGNFSGSATQPSPSGAPAVPGGIPDGSALRRSIAPGCATLLESVDDTNNSAVDFAVAPPAPRNNATPPTEVECTLIEIDDPPSTILRKKPPKRTRDRTPTFRFVANPPRATFQCKVDRSRFRSCRSPYTTKPLRLGKHTFKVRARNDLGFSGGPSAYSFTVLGKR
ncbi:MAG: hypothetical protein WBL45_05365 [Solirubrobacterales bacterium]